VWREAKETLMKKDEEKATEKVAQKVVKNIAVRNVMQKSKMKAGWKVTKKS
jgi:hypothetical protein